LIFGGKADQRIDQVALEALALSPRVGGLLQRFVDNLEADEVLDDVGLINRVDRQVEFGVPFGGTTTVKRGRGIVDKDNVGSW